MNELSVANPGSIRKKKWVRLSIEGADWKKFIGLQCQVYWPLDANWYYGRVVGYRPVIIKWKDLAYNPIKFGGTSIEPIRLPTMEEIRGQDIWNNCAICSAVSVVMGGGLGLFMGLFLGALDNPLMQEEMTGKQLFIYQAKQMGRRSWSSCKAFAVMGLIFSAAVVEKISDLTSRMEKDWPSLACPSSNGFTFWQHEWDRHGTCSESLLDQHAYFQSALDLKQKANLLQVLNDTGFTPGGSRRRRKCRLYQMPNRSGRPPVDTLDSSCWFQHYVEALCYIAPNDYKVTYMDEYAMLLKLNSGSSSKLKKS